MSAAPSPLRARLGISLTEVLFVLLCLGILAGVGTAASVSVLQRTHDQTAVMELQSMHATVVALRAVQPSGKLVRSELAAVLPGADTKSKNAYQMHLGPGRPSNRRGVVSWAISTDGSRYGMAQRSKSGRCVHVWASVTRMLEHQTTPLNEPCVATAEPPEAAQSDD
jgi:hypothetical protein